MGSTPALEESAVRASKARASLGGVEGGSAGAEPYCPRSSLALPLLVPDRLVAKAEAREGDCAGSDLRLNFDRMGLDALERHRIHARRHLRPLAAPTGDENI